jgi:hypothetical protein
MVREYGEFTVCGVTGLRPTTGVLSGIPKMNQDNIILGLLDAYAKSAKKT